MSRKRQRDDVDRVAEHARKVNFKRYLQDLEEQGLEDGDDDIIPSSHINVNELGLITIDFNYVDLDACLTMTPEFISDLVNEQFITETVKVEDASGVNWYIGTANGIVTFDSGLSGAYGQVSVHDLQKLI